ncbi:MAG TPA: methylmalonyl-CoA mutase family protein [Candidatus Binataceae bacterium]|nr:methylmalonyl-CoA mutase family protein [Candidatus Binataceae bacterium]
MAENERTTLDSARKNWEARKLAPALKRGAERKKKFATTSGIEIKRAYDPADLEAIEFVTDLGFPGEYPFTRGVQPTMYRGRLWTMRQYAGFGTAEESNRRYRYLFEQGQTGLSVAFDLPTQMGRDSDHQLAAGEVGRVGVSIGSLADMEMLVDGLPLDKISTSMTINATASILLAMYLVAAERRKVGWDKVNGTIQNDLLKEYIARGTYIYPPRGSMRIITDIFSFASREVPNWNTISISGYHIREAGSTAAQELAFTLADAIAYVDAALKAGLAVDSFASRLSFFFNVHNNFFEEIAKYRAARRMWAKIMKERFGAADERSMMMRFHAQTAGSTLTAQQVDNNVVRVTLQALAAVLGGAQSLHTNSKDEALALPTESSVLLALRTQQLIAYESEVADTIDPLGGSYYVEKLTTELEARAFEYLGKIDDLGGAVAAIERGYQQREIQNAAYLYQREIETKERIIVGVNQFTGGGELPNDILKVKPELEEKQKRNLARVRAERDGAKAASALARVESAARDGSNLMPPIIDAVRAWCTLGEISDAMRRVFGEYQPVNTL